MLRRSLLTQVLVIPLLVAGVVGAGLLAIAPQGMVAAYGGPDSVLLAFTRFAFVFTMALMFLEGLKTDIRANRFEGEAGEPWTVFPNHYDAGLIAAAIGLLM